tara:strand:- start:397 stop:573 length:177 start_codon:yes stop_codon:yes gene_type:complete
MGALKQMLIAEKMRINKEWDYTTQYEYAAWISSIKEEQCFLQKKPIKKEVKTNNNKLN